MPGSMMLPRVSTLTSDDAVISWYMRPNGLMRKWSFSAEDRTCDGKVGKQEDNNKYNVFFFNMDSCTVICF